MHKAASHLQRCLRKVLRENELELRRSVLLLHPSSTNWTQNVVTDVSVKGAYNPEVAQAAWRDEQEAAETTARANDAAIAKAEERLMAAYIRSACATEALKTPLTKELIKDTIQVVAKKHAPLRDSPAHPVLDWSSFSDTDDEASREGASQRPSAVKVDPIERHQQPHASTSSPPSSLRRQWNEAEGRREIMWKLRWLERRIRSLEEEKEAYDNKLKALAKEKEKNLAAPGQGEAHHQAPAAPPTAKCSPLENGEAIHRRPVKRRREGRMGQEFKLEAAFPGHPLLGRDPQVVEASALMEEDDSDNDAGDNALVGIMEQVLLVHKQARCLHAQLVYSRQNINRQGKIVHARSTTAPPIDAALTRNRVGARLKALECLGDGGAVDDRGPQSSPRGPGYLTAGLSFDMDVMGSPMGASKIQTPLKVEFINTPGIRSITHALAEAMDEKKNEVAEEEKEGKGEDESEDTSDEFYEKLHKPLEVAERARFVAPVVPPGQQSNQQHIGMGLNQGEGHHHVRRAQSMPLVESALQQKGRTRNRSFKF
ncbi:MAG: hypothetical protein CMJ52_09930 [Planctomycetaceae bacterium]|nr:hypothetical protein [Planctomycetaceae bacterium]